MNSSTFSRVTVALVLVAAAPLRAQEAATPARIQLVGKEKIPIANQFSPGRLVGPIKCDARGTVYIRPAQGPSTTLKEPVVGLAPDGHGSIVFDLGSVPELGDVKSISVDDYAAGVDGHVYEVVEVQDKKGRNFAAIIGFDPDGHNPSLVTLEPSAGQILSPRQITPFLSGQF